MEELIAKGGTFGLLLALVLAVGFLARFALQAYSDLKADRDDWKRIANTAAEGFRETTAAVKSLTSAVEARNRIEEEEQRLERLIAERSHTSRRRDSS